MTALRLFVAREQDIAEVVRQVRQLAKIARLSVVQTCYVATAAAELAANLWVHAGSGVFEARLLQEPAGLELLTTDHGPGIADIQQAMQDGFSTGGGLGCGLPGVGRLMDDLEIHSLPGQLTTVRARKWR